MKLHLHPGLFSTSPDSRKLLQTAQIQRRVGGVLPALAGIAELADFAKFPKKVKLPEKVELPDQRGYQLLAMRRAPCPLANPH